MKMTKADWQICIENSATNVAKTNETEAVSFVFRRYEATCYGNLISLHYNDIFTVLTFMIEKEEGDMG